MEKFNSWTQRNQQDSNRHLTIANTEKFQPVNSAGIQIATTPESNMEEIPYKIKNRTLLLYSQSPSAYILKVAKIKK